MATDVDDVLPSFEGKWEAFPPRLKSDCKFTPRVENTPVGNTVDLSGHKYIEIWLKLFSDALHLAMKFTNRKGSEMFGSSWKTLDWPSFMLFHCIILRMSVVKMPTIRAHFKHSGGGDEVVKNMPMSHNQFEKIYKAFSLYDPEEASSSGVSNFANKEKYDSLFKVKPVWNAAFKSFQQF